MATSVTSGSTYSRKANPYGRDDQSVENLDNQPLYLARSASTFSDKVEGFKLSEALQKFHHLLFIQVCRQGSDENFVDRIRDVGADNAWNVSARTYRFRTTIILGSTDLEGTADENDTIERHGCRGVLCGPELRGR